MHPSTLESHDQQGWRMCACAEVCKDRCVHADVQMNTQCACAHTHVCVYPTFTLPSTQESPQTLQHHQGGGGQSSTGLGAQGSRKPPPLSADHDRKAKCFLCPVIKKPELLKLPSSWWGQDSKSERLSLVKSRVCFLHTTYFASHVLAYYHSISLFIPHRPEKKGVTDFCLRMTKLKHESHPSAPLAGSSSFCCWLCMSTATLIDL